MLWFRIDNRLVHGQVIEGWLPYLHAKKLIVVNDGLASDPLQQQIMQLAIPGRIEVFFTNIAGAKSIYDSVSQTSSEKDSTLFLMANCQDALRMVEEGIPIPKLNIGNIHYTEGKQQLCAHIALSHFDKECLKHLENHGTIFDFRCVPRDTPAVKDWHD